MVSSAQEFTHMFRNVLNATSVLLLLGLVFGTATQANADKKAQIQALEGQKKQLQAQLPAHLKQIDEAIKTQANQLRLQEGEMKKVLNAKFSYEDKEQQQRIEARYKNIINYLKAEAKPGQMVEEAHKILQGVTKVLKEDSPDYGGHRLAAIRSVGAAELHVKKVLEQNTQEQRLLATKNLGAALGDLGQALQYSWQKYGYFGYGPGVPLGMPQTQQASDVLLAQAIPSIEAAQWFLNNPGLDKEQFQSMRKELTQKMETEKHATHAAYMAKIKNIDQEVAAQVQQAKKNLHLEGEQHKQQIKAQIAAQVKEIDQAINQVKKSK